MKRYSTLLHRLDIESWSIYWDISFKRKGNVPPGCEEEPAQEGDDQQRAD